MNFGIYLPPKAETAKVPVIYWLSGKKNFDLLAAVSWNMKIMYTHYV